MKTKTPTKVVIPQWKIDQINARFLKRHGRVIPNYMLPFNLGIKQFKRNNRGKSKLIADFKLNAWNSVRSALAK